MSRDALCGRDKFFGCDERLFRFVPRNLRRLVIRQLPQGLNGLQSLADFDREKTRLDEVQPEGGDESVMGLELATFRCDASPSQTGARGIIHGVIGPAARAIAVAEFEKHFRAFHPDLGLLQERRCQSLIPSR